VGRLAKKRILVIEGEVLIAMDIEKILSDFDLEVVGPACCLDEALELAIAE
jgi:hypothetical protein